MQKKEIYNMKKVIITKVIKDNCVLIFLIDRQRYA